ncbi:MAG: DUF1192 family protein [Rhodovarius sp.]|nr:DUF1192 family protein [Rhodovarius sp.]
MEEEAPRRTERPLAPASYDGWSVADFEAHLAALRAELARAEAALARHRQTLAAAEALFRPPAGS